MNLTHGNKGCIPWVENTFFLTNPLFCFSAEDVNQFLPGWMVVKWMAFAWFHFGADHEKMLVVDDVFTAEPLIECPWGGDIHFLRDGNKAPFADFLIQRDISVLILVHIMQCTIWIILSSWREIRSDPGILLCLKRIANDSASGIAPVHVIEYLIFEASQDHLPEKSAQRLPTFPF